jgi:hypothetical protein
MVFAAMTTGGPPVPIGVLIFSAHNRHQTATEAFDATSDGAGPTSDLQTAEQRHWNTHTKNSD